MSPGRSTPLAASTSQQGTIFASGGVSIHAAAARMSSMALA
jgi:hypothetical protein